MANPITWKNITQQQPPASFFQNMQKAQEDIVDFYKAGDGGLTGTIDKFITKQQALNQQDAEFALSQLPDEAARTAYIQDLQASQASDDAPWHVDLFGADPAKLTANLPTLLQADKDRIEKADAFEKATKTIYDKQTITKDWDDLQNIPHGPEASEEDQNSYRQQLSTYIQQHQQNQISDPENLFSNEMDQLLGMSPLSIPKDIAIEAGIKFDSSGVPVVRSMTPNIGKLLDQGLYNYYDKNFTGASKTAIDAKVKASKEASVYAAGFTQMAEVKPSILETEIHQLVNATTNSIIRNDATALIKDVEDLSVFITKNSTKLTDTQKATLHQPLVQAMHGMNIDYDQVWRYMHDPNGQYKDLAKTHNWDPNIATIHQQAIFNQILTTQYQEKFKLLPLDNIGQFINSNTSRFGIVSRLFKQAKRAQEQEKQLQDTYFANEQQSMSDRQKLLIRLNNARDPSVPARQDIHDEFMKSNPDYASDPILHKRLYENLTLVGNALKSAWRIDQDDIDKRGYDPVLKGRFKFTVDETGNPLPTAPETEAAIDLAIYRFLKNSTYADKNWYMQDTFQIGGPEKLLISKELWGKDKLATDDKVVLLSILAPYLRKIQPSYDKGIAAAGSEAAKYVRQFKQDSTVRSELEAATKREKLGITGRTGTQQMTP